MYGNNTAFVRNISMDYIFVVGKFFFCLFIKYSGSSMKMNVFVKLNILRDMGCIVGVVFNVLILNLFNTGSTKKKFVDFAMIFCSVLGLIVYVGLFGIGLFEGDNNKMY